MMLFLLKGEIGNREKTHKDTEQMSCEDEGRDRGDASTSQGAPEMASKPSSTKRGLEEWLLHSP